MTSLPKYLVDFAAYYYKHRKKCENNKFLNKYPLFMFKYIKPHLFKKEIKNYLIQNIIGLKNHNYEIMIKKYLSDGIFYLNNHHLLGLSKEKIIKVIGNWCCKEYPIWENNMLNFSCFYINAVHRKIFKGLFFS